MTDNEPNPYTKEQRLVEQALGKKGILNGGPVSKAEMDKNARQTLGSDLARQLKERSEQIKKEQGL